MIPPAPQYTGPHDPTYYAQQYAQHPAAAYLPAPRQSPEIISVSPTRGHQSTRVTVYFRSIYDFESPQIRAFLMFGQYKCESTLSKTSHQGSMYQYALSAEAPPLSLTNSQSPVPLHLILDDSLLAWESPSIEFDKFVYLEPPNFYAMDSPQLAVRKRKLSTEASPRRSPTKKQSMPQLSAAARMQPYGTPLAGAAPVSPFRRPSLPEAYTQPRRYVAEPPQTYTAALPTGQQLYTSSVGQTTPSLQSAGSPSWTYQHGISATRSPSAATMSASSKTSNLLPSPATGNNPQLIRTSTLQSSPPAPGLGAGFNPYAMYPANAKAILKIEGDLNTMSDNWTEAEREAKRRLVEFSRSQSGSVISATFKAVTPETRQPNSICVSCIWWAEKNECYVTSVDTIQLLESLVAVRFTVEEKNRIRRNLEGFRPSTVSKAKQESEDFFKLIMGFPSPKPRNIEKDVKVFPWRILPTALKKIIVCELLFYFWTTPRWSKLELCNRQRRRSRATNAAATWCLSPLDRKPCAIAQPCLCGNPHPHAALILAARVSRPRHRAVSRATGPASGRPGLRARANAILAATATFRNRVRRSISSQSCIMGLQSVPACNRGARFGATIPVPTAIIQHAPSRTTAPLRASAGLPTAAGSADLDIMRSRLFRAAVADPEAVMGRRPPHFQHAPHHPRTPGPIRPVSVPYVTIMLDTSFVSTLAFPTDNQRFCHTPPQLFRLACQPGGIKYKN
ncbi:hypothetical protein BAUCODRAFT_108761 [Baudoinia panamericana UAMH 10762]|uniref:DUF7082 domain-containing protein n=1 Tax=Baudoinia panamericana (strain UAMH 10762) TaxID=717646 RepID=M2LQW5_BAUPA|nr:uncharacterized protein BAUCODRAFT_108761 [Baudoinia panamericana UAMH 10762]EMC96822.1 hypothetical protein BAUCODRAFT_108761 [Baudoinia panamericana UAMH 10762]